MSEQKCSLCSGDVVYQAFSGGREYYCESCDTTGPYDEESQPPRLKMLAAGQIDALKAEMRAEMAARRHEGR